MGDDSKVMCRFCKCEIRAHHADLVQHASTDKHKRNASPFSSMRLTDLWSQSTGFFSFFWRAISYYSLPDVNAVCCNKNLPFCCSFQSSKNLKETMGFEKTGQSQIFQLFKELQNRCTIDDGPHLRGSCVK